MAIAKPTGPTTRDLVLAGGGELGELMRAYDWASTPVGDVEVWPQSLRTAVSILLASGYPMLIVWGADYVQFYNDAYAPVLGGKHPAALGQTTPECWAEIWDSMLGAMFKQVIETGVEISAKDLMFPLERHGFIEESYFDFSYSPIRDESYAVGGILVTCSETTARVLSERRLRVLRDMADVSAGATDADDACRALAAVLNDNAADVPFALVYLVAQDGRQLYLAGRAGVEAELTAAPPTIPLDDSAGDDGAWPVAQVLGGGGVAHVQDLAGRFGPLPGGPWPEPSREALVLPIARAGQDQPTGILIAGVSPRLRLDAEHRSFLGLVADQIATAVSNARALEEERRRAEALAELDRAKTAFFSNVSHEFRTPLSLLLGPIEDVLTRDGASLPEVVRDQLEIARRNGLRLLRLVNMLLDFSRIEAGRVNAIYQPTDLSAVTCDLASSFRSAMDKARLVYRVDCDDLPAAVLVDRDMWEKIVLNLISNAFKYTLSGEVVVSLHDGGDSAELVVCDTGIGIAEDDLPRVFERFHRVQGARARTHEGSGIGLALVQELVHLHGGTIQVRSKLGEGSEFTVRVPYGSAHLPADRINATATADSTAMLRDIYVEEALRWLPPPEHVQPAAVDLANILVVDDNADMRDYLARLLGTTHHVLTATDGQAALDMALADPPDLVLTDVMMPGLDGFELLSALRARDTTRLVPVVVVSARAGEEAQVEGLAAGADDYLVKPFTARELLARVNANLELSRLRREALRLEQAARVQAEMQRERLRQLFEQAPALMCMLSGPDHVFTLANTRYVQTIGDRPVLGKPIAEALPEIAGQGFLELLDAVFVTGEPHIGREARALLARGPGGALEEAYFDYIYAPVRDADGNVEGVFVHGFEVTELVHGRSRFEAIAADNMRLYVETQRMNAELDRQRRGFISTTAHDLRTPLAAIRAGSQLARKRIERTGADALPDIVRALASIEASSHRMAALIDELFDISRLGAAGQLVLNRSSVDLKNVVSRAIAEQQPTTPQHVLRLVVNADGLVGHWDEARLERCINNLLANAIKFSPAGGQICVTLDTDRDAEQPCAILSVEDQGIGIPAADVDRIFRRFERGSNTGDISGTGIGLAYVHDIVAQHGGAVTVRSTPGSGSTFVVRLPTNAV